MKFYHGTSLSVWRKIQEEGVLWGKRNTPSRCTYLALNYDDAKKFGEVVLEVDYEPKTLVDNYVDGCWQVRVYDPLPINQINRLEK